MSTREMNGTGKDFVEHLRTVQFSLAVVCIGLLVVITAPGGRDVQTAHQQIKDIVEAARSWQLDLAQTAAADATIKSRVRYVLDPYKLQDELPEAVMMKGYKTNVEFDSAAWIIVSTFQKMEPNETTLGGLNRGRFLIKQPTNLAEFALIWDWLADVSIQPVTGNYHVAAFMPTDGERQLKKDAKVEMLLWEPIKKFEMLSSPLALHLDTLSQLESEQIQQSRPGGFATPLKYAWVGSPDIYRGFYFFLLYPSDRPIHENLQDSLIHRFPDRWRRGRFNDVFRELNATAVDYMELPLDRIEKIVQKEESRSREPFEAFGVKFPADKTSRWGVLLLIGIQLYFFIHLTEYRRRKIEDCGIAWIGSYDSGISRVLFAVISLLLPSSLVFFVAVRGEMFGRPWENWVAGTTAFAASTVLTILTSKTYGVGRLKWSPTP